MPEVLSVNWGKKDSHLLSVYEANGGYKALREVLANKSPKDVIEEVKTSGVRGRGGAGFPAGVKWGFVPQDTGKPIYLCVNADESEPGTCKDRHLIEQDPHQTVEGAIIAAYAIQAKMIFFFIRGEFDLPYRRIMAAVDEAQEAGYFGENILGSDFSVDFIVHRGAGAYICGEETGLISAVEGGRGEPKIKPPFPAVEGAFRCPTIVNNVETLATVPWIINNGGPAYAAMGTEKSPGTKVLSISGRVKRPGIYEVELGYPIKKLIEEECGGMADGYTMKAIIPGGSSVPILPTDQVMELEVSYESCQDGGTLLGSGGMIVIDETQDMPDLLEVLAQFYHHESCGQCTPCREGTGWAHRIIKKINDGEGTQEDLDLLERVANDMSGRTICFLAESLVMPVRSFLKHFRSEFEAKLTKEELEV